MKKYKIGDIAFLNSKNIDKSFKYETINYLDTSSITENIIEGFQCLKISEDKIPSRCKRLVKNDTIVYSSVRPRLKHYGILSDPLPNVVVSTGFITIDANETIIDPYYLYYKLTQQEITEYISSIADTSVSSYPSIISEDIENIEIEIEEDINKQKEIVKLLKLIDQKNHNSLKIIENIEKFEKDLFSYWFLQFEFPDKNGDPYKSSGGKLIYNEELKMNIPENWDIISLDKCVLLDKGISYNSTDISSGKGIPMINLASIGVDKNYKYNELKYYDNKVDDSKKVTNGDMLVACTDLTRNADIVGVPIFVPSLDCCYTYSTDLSKINLVSDDFTKEYLYRLLRSSNFHNYIKPFASGTNVLHLDINGIYWYKSFVPPKDLQEKFSKIIHSFQELYNQVLLDMKSLENIKKNLEPLLMNGQIKIED